MDKYHERKQKMYNSVISLLNNNAAKFANYVALKTNLAKLMDTASSIKAAFAKVQQEDDESSGETGAKSAAREALIDGVLPLMGNLHSYAMDNSDNSLLAKVSMTESDFRKLREQGLVAKAKVIHDAAVPLTANLGDYLITDAVLTDIQSKIDAYEGFVGEQGSDTATHVGSRASMPALFKTADDLLENHLDKNMVSFRKADPEFYNQYLDARTIKEVGIRHKPAPPATPVQQAQK